MSTLTLTTDKLDYAPGETVLITLSGFEPGMLFNFELADDVGDPGDDGFANIYPAFLVVDGAAGDMDGTLNGEIVTQWSVPTDGSPDNATLNLTATGTDSTGALITASTTFTDATGQHTEPIRERSRYADQ